MKKAFSKRVVSVFLAAAMALSAVLPGGLSAKAELSREESDTLLYGGDTTDYYLGIAAHFALFGMDVEFHPGHEGGYADCEGRIAADEFSVESWPDGSWGYPVAGLLTHMAADQGTIEAVQGAAAIICNNAVSKTFGFVEPNYKETEYVHHTFVVSDEVENIRALPEGVSGADDYYNKMNDRLVKVPVNSLINFEQEMDILREKSRRLANTVSNGEVDLEGPDRVKLRAKPTPGTETSVYYFHLTKEEWDTACNRGIQIDGLPHDGYAIISVEGKNIEIKGQHSDSFYMGPRQVAQSDSDNARVLFNFYQAEQIDLYVGARGCILAPVADVIDHASGCHHAAQIIARNIDIMAQMGRFGFNLPGNLVTEDPAEYYTAHYMYYDTDGTLKELPAAVYQLFIGQENPPMPGEGEGSTGYSAGQTLTPFDGSDESLDAVKQALYSNGMGYYADLISKNCNLRFEVYEDGKIWFGSLFGRDLLDDGNYAKMTRTDDISWADTYTFDGSNAYFIMYPAAKVTVDVKWDDKQDAAQERPDAETFIVSLTENLKDGTTVTPEDRDSVKPLGETAETVEVYDSEVGKNVIYDVYTNVYTFEVPVLGKQTLPNGEKGESAYGLAGENYGTDGLFDISYKAPLGYKDTTPVRVDAGGYVDNDGVVAKYHIVLRKEYFASFYLVEPDGSRTEVYKTGFYDNTDDDYESFLGAATTGTLPGLTQQETALCLGDNATDSSYTVLWRNVETGKLYVPDKAKYTFDYEDVEFETVLRSTTMLNGVIPWVYWNIISYNEKYFIPGSAVYSRLKADNNADEYVFIQKKDQSGVTAPYAYDDELKEGIYKDDLFMLISLAYGVDTDRAVKTRVTISNEGYGKNAKVFHQTEKNTMCVDSYTAMPGLNTDVISTATLLAGDPYVNDYDGLNVIRMVVPVECIDDDLYLTVYYTDADGYESVWLFYKLDIDTNKFWTITEQ
ncbi:MAG: choice-of-anchor A family protein [Lachnospiraceae bacterium]|nr:choice-of-anchor A family protein [Lachnospiraceae bacterium]